jgi:UDP-N-acetylmuramyl pentapeptide phosphotransferase/UDP-N-acetylglucosamine-1-phosphate transferase
VSVAIALLLGLVAALGLERSARDLLAHSVLRRTNHRGHDIATASGILLVVAVLLAGGALAVVDLLTDEASGTVPRLAVLSAVAAFGALGLIDDLLGDDREKGLAGHLRAAAQGRATTGVLKLAGGAAAAVVLASAISSASGWQVLADAALIALAANLANLFDRAPGRTIKVGLLLWIPLAIVAGASGAGAAVALVVGAAVGLLPSDLDERSMLGDTGANALGAALGTAAVLVLAPEARTATAAALLALTLISERVSFSRVIASVPPLRALDQLGRARPEEARP